MPCDYSSRSPTPAKKSYTKLEKERLGIEQEEDDAEIWIKRVVEDFNHAITMEQLRKETQEDEELSKLLKELETNKKTKETSKGPYGKIYGGTERVERGDKERNEGSHAQESATKGHSNYARGPPRSGQNAGQTTGDHMVQGDVPNGE